MRVLDELQLTAGVVELVSGSVVPSLKWPVAVNAGVVAPTLTDEAPVTVIEVRAAAATVTIEAVATLTPDWLQVMFAV